MDFVDILDPAKRSRKIRRVHDAYLTPIVLASAIVDRLAQSVIPTAPMKIIEPACGEGDFIGVCQKKWPGATIVGIDIRDTVGEKIAALGAKFVHGDFLAIPSKALASADLIISNPPFGQFAEFVLHALSGMRDGAYLALLMRLGMLAWSEKNEKMADSQRTLWKLTGGDLIGLAPISPRPSFTDDGKVDSQEYAIAVWQRGIYDGAIMADDPNGPSPALWRQILWDKEKKPRAAGRKATP